MLPECLPFLAVATWQMPGRAPKSASSIQGITRPAATHLVDVGVGGTEQLDLVVVVHQLSALGTQPEGRGAACLLSTAQ